MALAPFTLDVALLPKAWGGHRLGVMYGDARDQLGEAWLCADLAETAESGAGGQAMISAVASGATGASGASDLHAVLAQDPLGLLGFRSERFPLLVKFLDAAEHLSVQVHPSPAYARAHPGAHVKSEAWVVLEAEAGAELMLGVEGIPDRAALAAAARDDSLPERLVRVPATPGPPAGFRRASCTRSERGPSSLRFRPRRTPRIASTIGLRGMAARHARCTSRLGSRRRCWMPRRSGARPRGSLTAARSCRPPISISAPSRGLRQGPRRGR